MLRNDIAFTTQKSGWSSHHHHQPGDHLSAPPARAPPCRLSQHTRTSSCNHEHSVKIAPIHHKLCGRLCVNLHQELPHHLSNPRHSIEIIETLEYLPTGEPEVPIGLSPDHHVTFTLRRIDCLARDVVVARSGTGRPIPVRMLHPQAMRQRCAW